MNPHLDQFLLTHLNLAVSAHNSQPFQLTRFSENNWGLIHVPSRELPIADPRLKDHETTAGAYLELIDILFKTKGYHVKDWKKNGKDIHFESEPFLGPNPEALRKFELAKKRFSFRGGAKEKRVLNLETIKKNVKIVTEKAVTEKIAKIYDDVNFRFLTSRGYIEELYQWLRFSKSHPNYYKDGLNNESMGLAAFEVLGASIIMKPKVFRFLSSLGIAKALVSEAAKINSASGLLVIFCPKETSYVEQGRIFYQSWLEMTEMDLYGCPMSLLSDAEQEREAIYSALDLDPNHFQLINVLRACVLPKNYNRYRPARLDSSEVGK